MVIFGESVRKVDWNRRIYMEPRERGPDFFEIELVRPYTKIVGLEGVGTCGEKS